MSHLPAIRLVDDGADDRELLSLVLRGAFGDVVIEEATDAGQEALIEGCGAGLDDIIARAGDISSRLVAERAFPADPRKRAGG